MEKENTGAAIIKAPQGGVQVADVTNVRALAKDLLDSGLFPGVRNIAGAVTVIQAGLELGIPPVAALNTMVVINGRLAMEAKALLAVAHNRAGVTWTVTKEGPEGCWMTFSRPGWPDVEASFTAEEAKAAGLLGKQNWKLYERDMYFARTAGRGVRRIAPDSTLGLYAKEEMLDAPANINGPAQKVAPAEVHKPAPVKDEWTDPPAPAVVVENGFALTPEVIAEGQSVGEGDPLDEAHHDTPERHAEKMADQPGRGPAAAKLAQFEQFAKIKATLAQHEVDEQVLWNGIHRFTQKTFGIQVTELDQFDEAQLTAVLAYMNRWAKAVEAEAKGAAAKVAKEKKA